MSAQVTVGELCLRATTAIYVTASAGTKQQNAPRPAHQASETIKTRMRIMRRLVPAHILGIKALRLTRSPSYYFFFFFSPLSDTELLSSRVVFYVRNASAARLIMRPAKPSRERAAVKPLLKRRFVQPNRRLSKKKNCLHTGTLFCSDS